ncbi:MAG: tRNA pseudouridine(38-40) synthase TruA [Thermoplasmata archaeon]|nr:MAG: tRNA pseudouridine(38-40) synthase TruA [Thermoplasmata archaeon]
MRLAIKLAYDGRNYHGFQVQKNARTVEGEVVRVLRDTGAIEGVEDAKIGRGSRTDAGVSALGNVLAFNTEMSGERIVRAITAECDSIWAWAYARVDENFNPRRAKLRVYRYYIPSRNYDVEKIKKCTQLFKGMHDFSNYIIGDKGMCEISEIRVHELGDLVCLEFIAPYFRRGMIRKIMSMIMDAGKGRINEEQIKKSFKEKMSIPMAPPEPLLLYEILYDNLCFRVDNSALDMAKKFVARKFAESMAISGVLRDMLLGFEKTPSNLYIK